MTTTYCKKEFLTSSPEPSTSTIVSFYGDIKWSKNEDGGNVSFIEISSCHERARLHRTFEMTEQQWIDQVKKLKSHIGEYLSFLEKQNEVDNEKILTENTQESSKS